MTFRVEAFIDDCQAALGEDQPMLAVRELMAATLEDVAALREALPSSPEAASQVLHRAEDLTVLQVSLPAGLKSPVHNHTIWAVIGIYEGQENNRFYRDGEDGKPIESSRRELRAGDLATLDETAIHAIENPLTAVTLGLHVYGGDLFAAPRTVWDPVSGQPLPFTPDRFATFSRHVNRPAST